MRIIGLLGVLHTYATAISRNEVLDVETRRRMLTRAVEDANDLRPSVTEFEASYAHDTIAELKQLVAEVK